jgi:hypothetical protein
MATRIRQPKLKGITPYKPGSGQTPAQYIQGLGGTLTNRGGSWSLKSPPTPAAPAAPAPQDPALLPPDARYVGQINALTNTRDTTLAGLTGERTRGLSEYGFTEDASGQPIYDPSNPFSKATLLKQSYDRSRAQARQSMGAGGQLYSGAFQNQQDYINRNQLQSEDALQKSLIDFLARNTGAQTAARGAFVGGENEAMADLVARSAENPLYSPTSGIQGPAPAPAAAPKVKPKPAAKKSTKKKR